MSGDQLTRPIGRSGVKASAVGLGTWAIGGWMWGGTDEAESIAAIQASLDAGVTLIDTAPAYGLGRSEEIVGKALTGRRDKAVIATKCGLVWHTQKGKHFFDQDGKPVHRYLGRDGIVHEVEESLRRMGAAEVLTAVFADKLNGKQKPLKADFVALTVPDRFVFGYGMDVRGKWRNLPAIYAMKEA